MEMSSTFQLPSGKLAPALLATLLAGLPTDDPRLLVGPTVGEDAAVIDFATGASELLVAKTDPITFATDEIGFYAVNVCANDIAVTGATPRYYLPTLLLPAGQSDRDLAGRIFEQIGDACRQLDIVVAGGHSEVTPAVRQPVIAGAMLGSVARDRFVRSGGAQAGDAILLAGSVPVEATSILARERRVELLARGWSAVELDGAASFLHQPGISIVAPALAAANAGLVTAMHDPTEGGLVTGLAEMAIASGKGMEIDLDSAPVPAISRRLCAEWELDPLGSITSGALIATCAPGDVEHLMGVWRECGWQSTVIGTVTRAGEGMFAMRDGRRDRFPAFTADELTRLWTD
jgi:hydrogenase maturation factor